MLTPELRAKVASQLLAAESGQMVLASRSILTLLQEAGVVVEMRLKPQIVGVHPSNRDGCGVNPHDVHALLADIVDVGWSYEEVKAICVEVASDEVREWKAALMAGTNGMLPSFEKAAVRFASLSASRTNQALRCVLARVAHRDECLCVGGCLSLEKIGSKDPLFQDACTLGLTWAVIPATLLQEFPNLATILQAAGNCSGQVARGEHELQVVRRLHNLWREEAKKGPKVDFVEVKRKALRSKPPCAAAVPWMYAFILKFSGGKDADLLIDSESFVRSTTTSTKSLGSDLYEVLSTDIKGTVNQFVRFRQALLKMAYVGSLTAGDAKKILGKEMTARIRVADDIMVETCQMVNSLPGCSHCDVRFVAVLGALDMDLATTTLGLAGKKKGGIASIAHECIIQLRLITGVEIASKFEAAALNEANVASQALASTRDLRKPMSGELAMREINSSGGGLVADASVLIKEMGFGIGMIVDRKADKVRATIVSLTLDSVELMVHLADGDKPANASASFLTKQWSIAKTEKSHELHQVTVVGVAEDVEFEAFYTTSLIGLELYKLALKHSPLLQHVQVFIKPKKSVVAAKAFDKSKLILVPTSLRVHHSSGDLPPGVLGVEAGGLIADTKFWLGPYSATASDDIEPSTCAPFWYLQTDAITFNMELIWIKGDTDGLKMPVARNCVPIKNGDILVLHKAKPVKAVVEPLVMEAPAEAKKRKKNA